MNYQLVSMIVKAAGVAAGISTAAPLASLAGTAAFSFFMQADKAATAAIIINFRIISSPAEANTINRES